MNLFPSGTLPIVASSRVSGDDAEWALAEEDGVSRLVVSVSRPAPAWFSDLEGQASEDGARTLLIGPTSASNAAVVRTRLAWLRPAPLGLQTSIGMGDRLGLATPGHVRALRAAGRGVAPIFAQQSIREMTRTGRTPQAVQDEAMWGAMREGWQAPVGADADHLKTAGDIDLCAAAGFTLFTIDPGQFVDPIADGAGARDVADRFVALPWAALEDSPRASIARYANRTFDIEGRPIRFDERTLMTSAVKYGRAVAHVSTLYRHLVDTVGRGRFEVEVSVDETETPTTHVEHVYVATELRRLGVEWISLAPRFVGSFEKGVDYIGDVAAFEADCALHAAIARCLGPYKLSLHSGSDKFSIYGALARQARGRVHLKTAGTSYLEALRTLAAVDPPLFREIYRTARLRYDEDRASYHVSADVGRTPPDAALADRDLPPLLDAFDARQVLHVTFGSVLAGRGPGGAPLFRDRLVAALRAHAAEYASNLEAHFARHLQPFTGREGR